MKKSFWDLVEKYGRPILVIPNTPRLLLSVDGRFYISHTQTKAPINPSETWYYRTSFGEEDFLLVKSQVEIPLQNFIEQASILLNSRIVEIRRIPGDLVRLTFDRDVSPLNRTILAEAVAARRIVAIHATSNMDDRRADVYGIWPDQMPDDSGIVLLFPSQSGPTEAELEEINPTNWDTEQEFFDDFKSFITRPFTDEL